MKKQIEGKYNKLNKCIIIEDVITTGQSVKEIIDLLENKVEIVGIITIINRNEIEKIGKYNIKYLLSEKDIINL
jgi:orotate phosphoribosyltransferase